MAERIQPAVDWNLATWEGSRREQHRRFQGLSFARKLEILEEMAEFAPIFQKEISAITNSSTIEHLALSSSCDCRFNLLSP